MESQKQIPTEEDWEWGSVPCPHLDLDVKYTRHKFFGKSMDEVIPFFFNNALMGMEEVCYMPPIPFRYYMLSFAKFLMSPKLVSEEYAWSSEPAMGAWTFLNTIKRMLQESPSFILPIIDELLPTIQYVAEHQELYGCDVDTDGSFPELVTEIKSLYAAQNSF